VSLSPSVDMLPFGMTIPATVPQRSEIPKGLMNYPVYNTDRKGNYTLHIERALLVLNMCTF